MCKGKQQMVFRTLATSVMTLVFSTGISSSFFHVTLTQNELNSDVLNQTLALFIPKDSLITIEVAAANEENC